MKTAYLDFLYYGDYSNPHEYRKTAHIKYEGESFVFCKLATVREITLKIYFYKFYKAGEQQNTLTVEFDDTIPHHPDYAIYHNANLNINQIYTSFGLPNADAFFNEYVSAEVYELQMINFFTGSEHLLSSYDTYVQTFRFSSWDNVYIHESLGIYINDLYTREQMTNIGYENMPVEVQENLDNSMWYVITSPTVEIRPNIYSYEDIETHLPDRIEILMFNYATATPVKKFYCHCKVYLDGKPGETFEHWKITCDSKAFGTAPFQYDPDDVTLHIIVSDIVVYSGKYSDFRQATGQSYITAMGGSGMSVKFWCELASDPMVRTNALTAYPIPHTLPEKPGDIPITRDGNVDIISSLKIFFGSGDDEYTENEDEIDKLDTFVNYGVGNLLTTTYAMTPEETQKLGTSLWNSLYVDNIFFNNAAPMENIIAAKMFPFDIATITGERDIKIGNVLFDSPSVKGKIVADTVQENTYSGGVINGIYGNFLDYEPFTNITFFLPFIGYVNVKPSAVLGKNVTFKYISDLKTGALKVVMLVDGTALNEYTASIGIDIPLSSTNRARVEADVLGGVVSMVASIPEGNVGGAVGRTLSAASQPIHTERAGGLSSACDTKNYRSIFYIIDYPNYQELQAFAHTYGLMCGLSKTIGNLHGFTIVNRDVDLSGIDLTKAEKEELRNILSSGFFA